MAESIGQGAKNFFALRARAKRKTFCLLTLDLLPMLTIHTPCQKGENNPFWDLHPYGTQGRKKEKEPGQMILKTFEEQIIERVKRFKNEEVDIFEFVGLEYKGYESGFYNFHSYEKGFKEKAVIQFNPYTGQVTALFQGDKGTKWNIGMITEL